MSTPIYSYSCIWPRHFFSYNLLAFFFPGSDQLANPFAHESIYILIVAYFSKKYTHWEDFPLLLSFKALFMCSSCPFWVETLSQHLYTKPNDALTKLCLLSFSFSCSYGTLHTAIALSQGRDSDVIL